LLPPDRGAVRGSARAALLSEWMTGWLGKPVEVTLAASYRQLATAIAGGFVDLAWAPPAICAQIHTGVRTMLTVVRYGATSCSAALVVRKDGPDKLEDLRGQRAAWVDPLSTCGHLLALAHFSDRGFDASTLKEQRFAGTYRDAVIDVVKNRADVTSTYVVDDDEGATLREVLDIAGYGPEHLRVLCTTAPAPYDALIIGERVPDWEDLQTRLLSLDRRVGSPSMLLEVCRADRFARAHAGAYARFEQFVDRFMS